MKESRCPECGTKLDQTLSEGLCPQCLMAMNMASQTELPEDDVPLGGSGAGTSPAPECLSPAEISKLFPHLEIIEVLGRGGMGVVYKARQKSLDRLVALKILAPEREKDDQFARRFSREAKILASLGHENIVTVHDFGESGGLYYLMMELVDGVNLRQLLKKGLMTPEKALAIVPSVCAALEYAHEQGVVHRDIKPENVLLDTKGRVKIADFGIAKILGKGEAIRQENSPDGLRPGGLTRGSKLGTPSYMAPEQMAQPTLVDHRADIYSLGIVFYELLTGELPDESFQPPSKKVAIDVRIDEAVIRAIEKEPERRYQTVAALKGDVETVTEETGEDRTFFDWRTWSPGQSELAREICSHMSEAERRGAMQRDIILGLMLAVPLVAIYIACDLLIPEMPLGLVVLIQAMVLVLMVPIYLIRLRRFLCGTAWAKQRGIRPEALKASWWDELEKNGWIGGILRHRKAILFSGLVLVGIGGATVAWLQRAHPIGATISASPPGQMFSADAQTLYAMNILGSDRVTYRFRIQGNGGALHKVWEMKVPTFKIAKDFTVLSIDEVRFDENGMIEWSDDGLRVVFRVRDVHVFAFDTVTGNHSFEPGFLPEREVVLRANEAFEHSFLDLDTGTVISAPTALIDGFRSEGVLHGGVVQLRKLESWMGESGADLACRPEVGLSGLLMGLMRMGNGDPEWSFDSVSSSRVISGGRLVEKMVRETINTVELGSQFHFRPLDVAIFRTRDGGAGVVEVLSWDVPPGEFRIRYKLVDE